MPPQRTPASAKTATKSERTHEENQERAYIAASRRSDRSLEARIESARRASEIHKRRTGRALRVTEQDVINEEMYEEEDGDWQMQMRRLHAHLESDRIFNGRLSAHFQGQYAARMAAYEQAMFNSNMNMQGQSMTPFFAYNPPTSPNATLSPQLTQQAPTFRQSPYLEQGFHRSNSISSPQEFSMPQNMGAMQSESQMQHQRRHSMATGQVDGSLPGTPGQAEMRPSMSRGNSTTPQANQVNQTEFFGNQQRRTYDYHNGFPSTTVFYDSPQQQQNANPLAPLTTTLPVEAQQMIGASFAPNSESVQALMQPHHGMPVPLAGLRYSYNPNLSPTTSASPTQGINQTLASNPMPPAPGKIDTSITNTSSPESWMFSSGTMDSAITSTTDSSTNYGDQNFDAFGFDFKQSPSSNLDGEGFFNDFVDMGNPPELEEAL